MQYNEWCEERAPRAVRDVLGISLHAEQIEASLALARGDTIEMLTGEGKTFAAIGAAMSFAAEGRRVHLITANGYLAERDAGWSGAVLRHEGFTTGLTRAGDHRARARRAYDAQVVFGDVAAFGFDFLRDQLRLPGDEPVQRGRDVAIVDEADAVLIDQARTPLVLTTAQQRRSHAVTTVALAIQVLEVGRDIELDLAHREVALTDAGITRLEAHLALDNLYADHAEDWPTVVDAALRARLLLHRDHDYVVHTGQVFPIDELTGRVAPQRRWPEGVQHAVEAKEGLPPSTSRRPIGQISIGSYFAGYRTLVGMSGTLAGAEDELRRIYGTTVVRIPPHQPVQRFDHPPRTERDRAAAIDAIAVDTARRHRLGQPVLVGTSSIADTAVVSEALRQHKVPHEVLTAVNDFEEARIIALAGRPGAATIATQLAGRGVDIPVAAESPGGLVVWIVGHQRSLRHEAQLRGRSGRQGQPGESCIITTPEDPVIDPADTERLDRDLREDVRTFNAVTDVLHEHLTRDRDRAASASIEDLLHPHSENAIQDRRERMGRARFDGAARLILRVLLVELWSEALEVLDSQQALARVMPIRPIAKRRWEILAVDTYREFQATVEREWRNQLLAFRFGTQPPDGPPQSPHIEQQPVLPEPAAYQHRSEWKAPSYNRFVRRHWYVPLPELPLVLHLDAISDVVSDGSLSLYLNLDDPSQTRIIEAVSLH